MRKNHARTSISLKAAADEKKTSLKMCLRCARMYERLTTTNEAVLLLLLLFRARGRCNTAQKSVVEGGGGGRGGGGGEGTCKNPLGLLLPYMPRKISYVFY